MLDVWDDLVDRDKPVSDDMISTAFKTALFALPMNPFYRRHFDVLMPIMVTAQRNWEVATTLERLGRPEDTLTAFILRSSYVDVLVACVELAHGPHAAKEAAFLLRSAAHSEGYANYMAAVKNERQIREGT